MSYRNSYLVILFGAIIAFGLPACPTIGQEKADSLTQTEHRWFVTLSLAGTSSGPAADVEKTMVASGFNQSSWGFFGSSTAYPFSETGISKSGFPWMIAVRYQFKAPFLLGMIISNAPIGTTYGYREPLLFLSINYSVFTMAPTVSAQLSDAVRLAIGPAIYMTKTSQENVGTIVNSKTAVKLGALVDLGLLIPTHSLFFCDLGLQYRYIGKVTIGPYEARLINSSASMPAAAVRYNHVFISVGVGLRM